MTLQVEKVKSLGLLVLEATDSFHAARGNEVYLDALEHYVLASDELDRYEILHLLKLWRISANKEFSRTVSLLDEARNCSWRQGYDY